jgi:phytoene dehydrogenase-like protein
MESTAYCLESQGDGGNIQNMGITYDVIVIGSGIGGLTSALEAANQGRSVLVLEADQSFGGYLCSFARKKFHFDPGLHYIGLSGKGQIFRLLLDELGLHEIQFNELWKASTGTVFQNTTSSLAVV